MLWCWLAKQKESPQWLDHGGHVNVKYTALVTRNGRTKAVIQAEGLSSEYITITQDNHMDAIRMHLQRYLTMKHRDHATGIPWVTSVRLRPYRMFSCFYHAAMMLVSIVIASGIIIAYKLIF